MREKPDRRRTGLQMRLYTGEGLGLALQRAAVGGRVLSEGTKA